MVVVLAPTPYYSWEQCNRKNSFGFTTEPINEAKHAHVTLLDIQRCNLDCLDHDAFNFSGASHVTVINIQGNPFLALPKALLQNMAAVEDFNARVCALWGAMLLFFWPQSTSK